MCLDHREAPRVHCLTVCLCLRVKPSSRVGVVESFVLRLASNPVSSVSGGARLSSDHVTCTIEPRGLVRFAQQSRDVTADVTGTVAQVLTKALAY